MISLNMQDKVKPTYSKSVKLSQKTSNGQLIDLLTLHFVCFDLLLICMSGTHESSVNVFVG